MEQEEKQSKPKKVLTVIVRIFEVIILLYIIFFISFVIIMKKQIKEAQIWKTTTSQNNSYYSELAMLPEISDSIEITYIRGIRDPEYCIETKAYDTINDLYDILPYSDEAERMKALGCIENATGELPEFPGIDEIQTVGIVSELPLNYEGVAQYYFHDRYIVQNEDGYRFVFFVQTT